MRFFITFGCKYAQEAHPVFVNGLWENGQSDNKTKEMRYAHPNNWIEVEAPDELAARQVAIAYIGRAWSNIYGESEWDSPDGGHERFFPGRRILTLTA